MGDFWLYNAPPHKIIAIIIAGLGGGLVKAILPKCFLVLPQRKRGGSIQLGFLADLFLGLCTALLVDGNPALAFFAAIGAAHIIEEGNKKFLEFIKAYFSIFTFKGGENDEDKKN